MARAKRMKRETPAPSSSRLQADPCLHYVPRNASEAATCDGLRVLQRLFIEGYNPPAEYIEELLKDASPVKGALALLLAEVLGLCLAAQALRNAGATYGPWSAYVQSKFFDTYGDPVAQRQSDDEDRYENVSENGSEDDFENENDRDGGRHEEGEYGNEGEATGGKESEKYNTILHWSVASRRADILHMVLGEKHSLHNSKNIRGFTAMHLAIEEDCLESLGLLLDAGADVNTINSSGDNSFHMAIKKDKPEILQVLISSVIVKWKKIQFTQILEFAVKENRAECVRVLVSTKLHKNVVNWICCSSLHLAAGCGHSEVLEVLLGVENVDVNKTSTLNKGKTPLFCAVESNRKECVRLLLAANANVNVDDYSGNTPLHNAVVHGYREVLEMLLKGENVDVDKQCKFGGTALFCAVQRNGMECMRLLLEANADLNAEDYAGDTPLLRAARIGRVEMLEAFIKRDGAIRKDMLQEALCMAVISGKMKSVHLVLEQGAQVHEAGRNGMYPIHYAALCAFPEAMKVILDCEKVEVDIRDCYGRTALYSAFNSAGHVECAQQLIDAGADIYFKTNQETLLHKVTRVDSKVGLILFLHAAREANSTRFTALLEARNKDGYTALHIASAQCSKKCIKLLLKAGCDVNATTPDEKNVVEWCGSDKVSEITKKQKKECIELLNKAVTKSLRRAGLT